MATTSETHGSLSSAGPRRICDPRASERPGDPVPVHHGEAQQRRSVAHEEPELFRSAVNRGAAQHLGRRGHQHEAVALRQVDGQTGLGCQDQVVDARRDRDALAHPPDGQRLAGVQTGHRGVRSDQVAVNRVQQRARRGCQLFALREHQGLLQPVAGEVFGGVRLYPADLCAQREVGAAHFVDLGSPVELGVAGQAGCSVALFVGHQRQPAARRDPRIGAVEVDGGADHVVGPPQPGRTAGDQVAQSGPGAAHQPRVGRVVAEQCSVCPQCEDLHRSGCRIGVRAVVSEWVVPHDAGASVVPVFLDGGQDAHVPSLAAAVNATVLPDDEDRVAGLQPRVKAIQVQVGVAVGRPPPPGLLCADRIPLGARLGLRHGFK